MSPEDLAIRAELEQDPDFDMHEFDVLAEWVQEELW